MTLKYFLTCSLVCAAATSLDAANTIDYGEMEPDKQYEYEAGSVISGQYTPTESGVMRCYSTGDEITPFKDAEHTEEYFSTSNYYGSDGEKVRIYTITAGETIYFHNMYTLDTGTFRFSVGKEKLELKSILPAPGNNLLSISTNYDLTLGFSIPVKYTKCTLAVNDVSVELSPAVNNAYIVINWFRTLRDWYNSGKIQEGDELTVTLTGVRDITDSSNRVDRGDGLGKVILKYKIAAKPLELVNQTGTPQSGAVDFLSYYLPNGSEGVVSLIFNGDIDPNCHPEVELTYGDIDNIEAGIYTERNIPVNIKGNVLSVDLRGKKRLPEDMVSGLPAQKDIVLRISRIKGKDGQYVVTGYSSSPYSFSFSYNFKTVVYSLAADWMPVAESMLTAGEPMEIWVLNGDKIQFDSVDFSYVKDGVPTKVSIPYSSLKVSQDGTDAMLYNFDAPALDADPDSEITVTFGNMECADGLDHTTDIFVRYKAATAAVEGIQVDPSDNVYYDLTGRRVASPSKGIYILNGEKIMIK